MRRMLVASLALWMLGLPIPGLSQDNAQSIIERSMDLMMERRGGVMNYIKVQSTMGNRILQFYERVALSTPDGGSFETFRLVPITEIEERRRDNPRPLTPEELELMAGAAEMTGEALADGLESELAQAGLPPSLLSMSGSESSATLNPRVMMGDYAAFLRVAAAGDQISDGRAEAAEEAGDMAEFAQTARLVGTETVDGRSAFHLRADGLNRTQSADGQEFTIQAVSMWIDSEHYVPLRMKVDGVATDGGDTRPFSIERIDADYRTVPGSNMYESFRQTLRIGGVMDESQQEELREAQEQLAELERQIEAMPAQQRAMMERMMGSQLETIRRMASGGGFEVETIIQEIRVNSDLPSREELGRSILPTGAR